MGLDIGFGRDVGRWASRHGARANIGGEVALEDGAGAGGGLGPDAGKVRHEQGRIDCGHLVCHLRPGVAAKGTVRPSVSARGGSATALPVAWRRSNTSRTAMDPSPIAVAARLMDPMRTSPAGNTPGRPRSAEKIQFRTGPQGRLRAASSRSGHLLPKTTAAGPWPTGRPRRRRQPDAVTPALSLADAAETGTQPACTPCSGPCGRVSLLDGGCCSLRGRVLTVMPRDKGRHGRWPAGASGVPGVWVNSRMICASLAGWSRGMRV